MRMGTGGGSACVGVGRRRVGRCRIGGGAGVRVGTLGGWSGVVDTLKIAASCLIAAICSVPREGKGESGDGLDRAMMSSWTAAVAASAEEVAGMVDWWGENSTERAMRLALVEGTYQR